jgi:hypothetical protein
MARSHFLPAFFAASLIAAALPAWPQNEAATGIKVKQIPAGVVPTPFPSGSEAPGRVHTIEFIEPEKMSEKDKLLEADAESSIQERAGWAGLEFNEGKWSYRQIACPALPNHLFLQFQRSNGSGDVSLFSVSIPRSGDGRIRIVPIQRRGYSLFSPAPINALTISAFNHIRGEERSDKSPDWLTTGLCYAALAGAHPQAVLLPDNASEQTFPAASAAILHISQNGDAVIHFSDVNPQRPMQWSMSFNGKGRLLKASHSPAPLVTAKAVAGPTDHPTVKPIPQTIVDLNPPKP